MERLINSALGEIIVLKDSPIEVSIFSPEPQLMVVISRALALFTLVKTDLWAQAAIKHEQSNIDMSERYQFYFFGNCTCSPDDMIRKMRESKKTFSPKRSE